MGILFVIYAAILALGFKISQLKVNNKFYVYLCGIFLFLISALRHKTVGRDTIGYIKHWKSQNQMDWNTVLENAEPGFSVMIKLLSVFSNNSVVFLSLVALIFTVSICYLIFKYSKDFFLSFVLLISLGIFYFSMAGLRQTVAMSILMFSIRFIIDRKLMAFLLLTLVASFFHNTAVCFIIIYPISYLKIGWKHLVVLLGLVIVVFNFQNNIISFLFNTLAMERFAHYEGVDSSISLTGFFIQLAISIYCLVNYKNTTRRDPRSVVMFNLMLIGLGFQMFTPIIGEFFRLSLYFNIFNILLVPNVLMLKKFNYTRVLEYLGIAVISIMYLTFSSQGSILAEYKFFWE